MNTIDLTKATFDQVIQDNPIVLVDFWAQWCGPCKTFAKTYAEVAAATPDIIFGKIDTEAEPELAADFNIRSIPTLLVMKERVVVYFETGALPKTALLELIEQARGLDMAELKEKIAKIEQER